jgi:hypothetical protein
VTNPNVPVDGVGLAIALANFGVFVGVLECWHQFRDNSGWAASGWFALLILAMISMATTNKILLKRKARHAKRYF